MTKETRQEIARRLNDGEPVTNIAKEMRIWSDSVRAIRDDLGIPARKGGHGRGAKPVSIPAHVIVDPDEVDGDPKLSNPLRIPVGQWCTERPNQARWMALADAAHGVEREALRVAMAGVLGLSWNATDHAIGVALTTERRTAEELAGLYLAARGAPC